MENLIKLYLYLLISQYGTLALAKMDFIQANMTFWKGKNRIGRQNPVLSHICFCFVFVLILFFFFFCISLAVFIRFRQIFDRYSMKFRSSYVSHSNAADGYPLKHVYIVQYIENLMYARYFHYIFFIIIY